MNRRSFFRTVAAAAVVAPVVPTLAPTAAPIPRLVFHPSAFSLAMKPVNRFDVLFGVGTFAPTAVARIVVPSREATEFAIRQIRAYGPPERLPL